MNKKGFTLIELLAVIVILAIIALIAVPIVLNIIKDARETSNERSIELYVVAVKQGVIRKQIKDTNLKMVGDYKQKNNGRTLTGPIMLEIEYDGKVECNEIIILENSDVILKGCIVNDSNFTYSYSRDTGVLRDEMGKPSKKENNEAPGITVYFDVKEGQLCDKKTYELSYDENIGDYTNSLSGYNGIIKTHLNQNSCLKFYKYKEDATTQTMILDHNTSLKSYWVSKDGETNINGPYELLSNLYDDTKDWNGTITPENYVVKNGNMNYVIDYSNFKAKLITAEEAFALSTDTIIKPAWLYDRTMTDCVKNGCLNNSDVDVYGFWTATGYPEEEYRAWYVMDLGYVNFDYATIFTLDYGVRPVIIISK